MYNFTDNLVECIKMQEGIDTGCRRVEDGYCEIVVGGVRDCAANTKERAERRRRDKRVDHVNVGRERNERPFWRQLSISFLYPPVPPLCGSATRVPGQGLTRRVYLVTAESLELIRLDRNTTTEANFACSPSDERDTVGVQ